MKAPYYRCLLFAVLLVVAFRPTVRGAFPTVALKPVVLKQVHAPTTIAFAPDGSGRLFVCDQPGRIYIIKGGMLLPTPFLDITSLAVPQTVNYSERGLLGLAFHPGYANQLSPGYGKFYINYNKPYVPGTDPAPPQVGDPVNCVTVVAEFQVSPGDPNVATLASERRLLVFTQPQSNHNGGQLEFGPDGFLYIGTGDGGGSNDNGTGHSGSAGGSPTNNLGNGQDKTRFLGKILRIDPLDPDGAGPLTYTIPATNPFFNDPTLGLKKEIYAFGLRNPWRFSFDKRPGGTNRLFCGDVGQGRIEEINLIVAGGNYGWRYKEGVEFPLFSSGAPTNPMPNPGGPFIDPIAMYAHPGVVTSPVLPQLGLSVTGGFVYRGAAIPALQGKYVFGDYGSTGGASDGRVLGLEETAPGSGVFTLTQAIPLVNSSNPIVGQRILCLGEDESGEIYLGLKTNGGVLALDGGLPAGGIYKLVPLQNAATTLTPAKDNTIFSEDEVGGTFLSDGLGYLYAGQTGSNFGPYFRRALLSFDIAAQLPAGAVVQSAQLQLRATKLGPSAIGSTMALHRLTETWGEGTSVNGSDVGTGAPATTDDATWSRRFYNTSSWTTAGGTYQPVASASTTVPGIVVTFSPTTALQTDVQGWLNTPASNAGWILLGDENVQNTAIQFASKQKGANAPALQLTYGTAPGPTHFEAWLATYFPTNFVGQYVDPNGDIDGDGIPNQFEYAFAFSPIAFNAASEFTTELAPGAGGSTDMTITFRRDPAATDLTYRLQTSGDLLSWTTIVTSTAGGTPSGSGYVSDVAIAGQAPLRRVTALENLPAGSNDKKFVRLRVDRAP